MGVKVGAKWINGWDSAVPTAQCWAYVCDKCAPVSADSVGGSDALRRAPQQLADLLASISTGVKSISVEGQRPPCAH